MGIRELQNGIKPENELFKNIVGEQIVENKNDTLVIEEGTFIGTQKLSYLDIECDKVSSDYSNKEYTKFQKQMPFNGRLAKECEETKVNDDIPVIQKETILTEIKETVQNIRKVKTPLGYDPEGQTIFNPEKNSPEKFYKMVRWTEVDELRQQEEKKLELERKQSEKLKNKERKKRGIRVIQYTIYMLPRYISF